MKTIQTVTGELRAVCSEEKAQKMVDLCAEFDWVPVSMKNDWITIYGESVTYLPAAGEADDAA